MTTALAEASVAETLEDVDARRTVRRSALVDILVGATSGVAWMVVDLHHPVAELALGVTMGPVFAAVSLWMDMLNFLPFWDTAMLLVMAAAIAAYVGAGVAVLVVTRRAARGAWRPKVCAVFGAKALAAALGLGALGLTAAHHGGDLDMVLIGVGTILGGLPAAWAYRAARTGAKGA